MRTPLASLKLGLSSPDPQTLRALRSEVEYLDALFDNVASLVLLRSGGLELARSPVDLRRLAEDVALRLSVLAQDRGVNVDVQGTASPVSVDGTLVAQAVTNLVHNAIQYGRSHVQITVQDHAVHVSDDGPGIAPELVEHATERHVRGTAGGAGLGLSIARGIAQAHGGDVVLQRLSAGGTLAELRLPPG